MCNIPCRWTGKCQSTESPREVSSWHFADKHDVAITSAVEAVADMRIAGSKWWIDPQRPSLEIISLRLRGLDQMPAQERDYNGVNSLWRPMRSKSAPCDLCRVRWRFTR